MLANLSLRHTFLRGVLGRPPLLIVAKRLNVGPSVVRKLFPSGLVRESLFPNGDSPVLHPPPRITQKPFTYKNPHYHHHQHSKRKFSPFS